MARMQQLRVTILVLFPLFALLITGCNETDEVKSLKPSEHGLPDVTLEYEIENPDSISRTVVKIKGSRVRSDREDGSFSSILTNEGEYFVLNHDDKTYQKVVDDFPESLPSDAKDIRFEQALKMRFTDRQMKIGNWECMEFLILDTMDMDVHHSEKSRMTAWIATDFAEGALIQSRMDSLKGGHFSNFLRYVKNRQSKDFAFPGMIIMAERTGSRGLLSKNTCKRISFGAITDKVFEIPKNYSEIFAR